MIHLTVMIGPRESGKTLYANALAEDLCKHGQRPILLVWDEARREELSSQIKLAISENSGPLAAYTHIILECNYEPSPAIMHRATMGVRIRHEKEWR